MSETLVDSKSDIHLNINFTSEPKFYRLKVNINGFRIEDIKVNLVEHNKERVKVKVSAFRTLNSNNQDKTEEYSKLFDIFKSKYDIKTDSMRYYINPLNPLYLIIEFKSNSDKNVHVNLDNSCESLIETAAKSLLNVKNIEDLRSSIQDPFNSSLNNEIDQIFSLDLIKDLSLATKTTFTPIKLINRPDGKTICQVEVKLPVGINSACLDSEKHANEPNNIRIGFNQLELRLEAITVKDSVTSTFSKKINLPKDWFKLLKITGTKKRELSSLVNFKPNYLSAIFFSMKKIQLPWQDIQIKKTKTLLSSFQEREKLPNVVEWV